MKGESSALFDFYADFYAEGVAYAGTIKGHFVLVAAGGPRRFQTHRHFRQSTRGFVYVDHEDWSVLLERR
jgi:hypothetical protein